MAMSTRDLTTLIHKELQDRDYRLLETNHPIFMIFQGGEILYNGEPGYPVFIDEAAYSHEDTAFILTDRIEVSLKQA